MQIEKRLHINVGESYDVIIGHGLLEKSGQLIRDVFSPRSCVIVSETNVAPLYLKTVQDSCEEAGFTVSSFFPEAAEFFCQNIHFLSSKALTAAAENSFFNIHILTSLVKCLCHACCSLCRNSNE